MLLNYLLSSVLLRVSSVIVQFIILMLVYRFIVNQLSEIVNVLDFKLNRFNFRVLFVCVWDELKSFLIKDKNIT